MLVIHDLSLQSFETARNSRSHSLVLTSSNGAVIRAISSRRPSQLSDFSKIPSLNSYDEKDVSSLLPHLSTPRQNQLTVKRDVSNPFEVLYSNDASFRSANSNNPSPNLTPQVVATPRNPIPPGPPTFKIPNPPPIVTVIDQDSVKRSGSVISNSASLRHRNTIKQRNKMVRKQDMPLTPTSSTASPKTRPKKSRISFLFPVKRNTSFKQTSRYTPLPTSPSRFNSKQDVDDFFRENNVESLLKEFLPTTMKLYSYKGFINPKPTMDSITRTVKLTDNNTFEVAKPTISAPVKDTFVRNRMSQESKPAFKDMIYDRYRNEVFANNYKVPPRFEEMYPNEVQQRILNDHEIELINTKVVFEVLLRRTLAAKIDYRLTQHGFFDLKKAKKTRHKDSSSNLSDSSSGSDGGNMLKDLLPHLESSNSSSHADEESINTDDLMQQNASLFSELLPSPQISYASDIFGDVKHDGYLASLDPVTEKTPEPASSELYVNDFNKEYASRLHQVEQTLFNSKVYMLKPMNRSNSTLSTSNENLSQYQSSPPLNSPVDYSRSSYEKLSMDKKRQSESTENTSVLQELDDLASEISMLLKKENQLQNLQHGHLQKFVQQSLQEKQDDIVLHESPAKTQLNPSLEIKSMKGSIIGTHSAYSTLPLEINPPLHTITETRVISPQHRIQSSVDNEHN